MPHSCLKTALAVTKLLACFMVHDAHSGASFVYQLIRDFMMDYRRSSICLIRLSVGPEAVLRALPRSYLNIRI
jgi:hypothetical protein